MFAMVRLAAMLMVVLTIVSGSLWFYARAVKRDKLEAEWRETDGDRATFVRNGLNAHAPILRRNLIIGVYIVPSLLLVALITATNW